MARALSERLIHELTSIREELKHELERVSDAELDWAPSEGMKSYRAQIQEIGAMTAETTTVLTEGRIPSWEEAEAKVRGESVAELVASLDETLATLLSHLRAGFCEERIAIPEEWEAFFGTAILEPEELVRWIARHEYYHLGQIVTYNWIRGKNPYKP